MHLSLPDHITPAWEGDLEPPAIHKGDTAMARPRVTIGQPELWTVAELLPADTWVPPRPATDYWLLRLACTLHHTTGSERIREAQQSLTLRAVPGDGPPDAVYAFSLFPERVTAEETRTVTVALGPELKFTPTTGISAGSIGTTLSYRSVFPVIQSYGAGEPDAYWVFQRHASHPLTGSQFVYAIIAAARTISTVRVAVGLVVTTEQTLGPIRFGLSREAQQHASFIIER
jgi:hypothetical protein